MLAKDLKKGRGAASVLKGWTSEQADAESGRTQRDHRLLPLPQVFPGENLPANAGDIRDAGSIPGSGRSPGGGHGNPFQCSCLENPKDRGAWQAIAHGVTQSQT